jgi:alanine racemase
MNAWVEINLDNIAHNVKALREFINPKSQILAVVKSNAYGHGMVEVSKVVLKNGASWLGVDKIEDAVELRKAKIVEPILIMGPIIDDLDSIEEGIREDVTFTISSLEQARTLFSMARKLQKKANVHIKVDSGMNRYGLTQAEVIEEMQKIKKVPKLHLQGIYSHLAEADNRDKTATFKQIGIFQEIIMHLEKEGMLFPIKHIANSGAALGIPSAQLDMCRLGIVIYGLFPSPELKSFFDLRPSLEYKTKVAQIKRVGGSVKIGYGGSYTTKRPSLLAIIPIGYADGIDRGLSSLGKVLVGGKRANMVGRICMNATIIDITDISGVKPGDEVVIIGQQGLETITAGEIAGYLGTINYEIVSRIPSEIPRKYIR